jgi:ABC-type multidrug transport system ATPase subunit
VPDRPNACSVVRTSGQLVFEHVSFAYAGCPDALHDLSFAIEAGSRVGLEGRTGAGKTTLVSLVARLYDPIAGRILLDGVDLRDYQLADLRRQIGFVLQEPVLFAASIAENIAYARPDAGADEIVAAARAACAHDFIDALPDGYDTLVGERGMRLSGGERQRLSLARAFLKDAPILVLDEPTSALDTGTEAALIEIHQRVMAGRTCIIVAHRPQLLDGCDLRLQLEAGRLVPRPRTPTMIPARGDTRHSGSFDATGRSRPTPPARAVAKRATERSAHPAVAAWCALSELHRVPARVDVVHESGKSATYRLAGVGDGASAVIAKRCFAATGSVERTVYESVLPRLPVTALRYYGAVADGVHTWLFLEDAGAMQFAPTVALQRSLVSAWLATMHTSAEPVVAGVDLPNRGVHHTLDQLRAARDRIAINLGNPVLTRSDRKELQSVIAACDALERRWPELEACCRGAPVTLVHGDFRPKNVHLQPSVSSGRVYVLDWETAGRGVPAVDLAPPKGLCLRNHLDLVTYFSIARARWPALSIESIDRLMTAGTIFRRLAAMDWASLDLASPHVARGVARLRIYRDEVVATMPEVTRAAARCES